MQHVVRHRPARPLWMTVPLLIAQGMGVFVLPFVVGLVAAMFFDVTEVIETLPAMLAFTVLVLFPVSLMQVLGLILKSRRELQFWRGAGQMTLTRLADVLLTHLSVVTLRGWSLLFGGTLFVVASLGLKWASFGMMAVLALFLFYLTVGWTLFVSTFMVRTFEKGLGRDNSGIQRRFDPAVCLAGEPVDEVFQLRRVPVPWGYTLLIEDPLSPRLQTESRYAVGSGARGGEVEARGRMRATPRGHYHLGPAKLWYSDALGITKVSIASVAFAELKVLPRIRPVQIIDPPRSHDDLPDVLTKPDRFATDDPFRFREYVQGDDSRRIHWKLSMKQGRLNVRVPETKEISTQDVLLVIDSFLPKGQLLNAAHGADDILDGVVEAALGIVKELVSRGDRVTLVAACSGHDRNTIELEKVACRAGTAPRWQDIGARCRWQGEADIPQLLAEIGDEVHGIIVTARFTATPPQPLPGQTTTWVFLDPSQAVPEAQPPLWTKLVGGSSPLALANWWFRLPEPAGADGNALLQRAKDSWRIANLHAAREALRNSAHNRAGATLRELQRRGDAVYRLERIAGAIRLVGLQARKGQRRAS